jgi:hypothetical protein
MAGGIGACQREGGNEVNQRLRLSAAISWIGSIRVWIPFLYWPKLEGHLLVQMGLAFTS